MITFHQPVPQGNFMVLMRHEKTALEHGNFLNERRLDLGLKWSEVARDMERFYGQSVTPDYLSKIKRGAAPLAKMSLDAREALRSVLRINANDWERETGLYTPANESIAANALDQVLRTARLAPETVLSTKALNKSGVSVGSEQLTDSVVKLPFTMKNVYDLAQASRPLAEMEPDADVSPIPVPNELLRPGTELFRVRGDSMQIGQGGILEGDLIFVDTRLLSPVPEGVFVIHIPGDGVTVKRVRKLGAVYWLFSDNPDQMTHPPFAADDAHIVGRVHNILRIPDVKL